MVESPGKKLMRQALVLTEADLLHKCGMNHVLVVDSIPNVVLLGLHDAQHFQRIHVVVRLERCNLSSRIVTEIDHGCVVGARLRVELRFDFLLDQSSPVF